ncbi:M61 family metallopeptidase [Xanthomonas translucens]|uniref:M61 family metallopeptidase n=1 Tax=Xanthomonas campestris pv. translucens TaxID=343 RepID=UPI00071E8120|nr:tetratricopeptide repeat protein [Xanthomonas translucens]KTF37060.1 peptidase M61 [Xanthomonas translucens pv. translucens]KWV16684.1 peptidase M61 [Xanthomonas translucens]MCS3360758.1 tetratricopeptide repeat protein [Xanthomonas translucens pv. translucens]MCS3373887.1 tetratricopeptide repeat protein [Xanthomonas translucens pv. translucens]MCT8274680.1 tetratricopeptide repeat protein [Xanthomonas translucens pv. translucens]
MTKSTAWMAPLLLAATAAFQASAQTAPPQDVPFAGTLKIDVDATDLAHRIFRVRTTIPATPGPMTLLYPQWIPGNHSPTGPIDKLAGLVIKANGQVLPWKRDQFDVYAFKVEVPQGASEIVAEFQFLSSQGDGQGRVMMTPEMLNLQWNTTALYPAGTYARNIKAQASVTLPPGWSYATALETATRVGDTVTFKPIDFDDLVDSPMFAGKYYKRIALDADGKAPVYLNVFADEAKSLDAKPEQIKAHAALVQQMDKLYGARHFDHYDFLLALTEKLGGIGLEHHRSSENSGPLNYFTEWDKSWDRRDLLSHEFNHSWNGKYRRGADLATPNFNVPMGDSLLWLYEGQTQFWGEVLAARSGLWTQPQARDALADVAATYQRGRPGLAWRALQDTTNDPTMSLRRPRAYRSYQMSEDYYSGGQMLWLEIDAKLRELSGNKRSIDDFAKAFFGMHDGAWDVNPYTFEDIVATLDGVARYDWAPFLRSRVDGHGPLVGGIEASGWKLVYTDQPNEAIKTYEATKKGVSLTYSLGLSLDDKGSVQDVLWDGPAFDAGIIADNSVVAVNGREYSADAIKEAITAAKGAAAPIELLVKRGNRYDTLRIAYHGGLQYPHLERIAGKPDRLSALYKAR